MPWISLVVFLTISPFLTWAFIKRYYTKVYLYIFGVVACYITKLLKNKVR